MNEWCNNPINKIMANQFPHDFSIMDIDGMIVKEYGNKIRILFTEIKNIGEKSSNRQNIGYSYIFNSFNWSKYDIFSGIYKIYHNTNLDKFDIYKMNNDGFEFKGMYYDINDIYEFYSAKNDSKFTKLI